VPDDLQALIERAEALCQMRRFTDAAELLWKILSRDPGCSPAWQVLARTELGSGQSERALRAAERAIELEPCTTVPLLLAALALLALERDAEAVASARAAARADPDDPRALDVLARVLVSQREQALSEARAVAADLVEMAPRWPGAHLTSAQLAMMDGDRDAARASYLVVLQLDPANAAAQHAGDHAHSPQVQRSRGPSRSGRRSSERGRGGT
jgi:tetratricopeptide (TPR) repeat protein